MITGVSPYRPRHVRFVETTSLGGIEFKIYAIAAENQDSTALELLPSAYSYINEALPTVRAAEGQDHGLGYVILHAGEMSNWLLTHWWAHSDIAMRMLASAELGSSVFCSQDHGRFHACVWEHVVIDHERDSWVRHAMIPEASTVAYLNDTLPDGPY